LTKLDNPQVYKVTFSGKFQKEERVYRRLSWEFKVESSQILKVSIYLAKQILNVGSSLLKNEKKRSINVPPVAITKLKGDIPRIENHRYRLHLNLHKANRGEIIRCCLRLLSWSVSIAIDLLKSVIRHKLNTCQLRTSSPFYD